MAELARADGIIIPDDPTLDRLAIVYHRVQEAPPVDCPPRGAADSLPLAALFLPQCSPRKRERTRRSAGMISSRPVSMFRESITLAQVFMVGPVIPEERPTLL